MNWFSGSIPEAIGEVKNRQKILLVFVVGEDDLSSKMTVTYNDPAVAQKLSTQNCVALKLVVNSVPYQQFSQIYPVVVIPSSFFIGKNGLPIEIITGHLEPQEFIQKMEKIFQLNAESNGPRPASNLSQGASTAQDVVEPMDSSDCPESGASTSKDAEVSSSETSTKAEPDSSQAGASTDALADDKLQRAKDLIETNRQNKIEEEKKKQKEEELKRRELGKAVQQAKQTREEAEMKQWAETRAKEKEEERQARERVRAQIAQDRAERAAKFQQSKAAEMEVQTEKDKARIKEEQEKAAKEAAMRSTMARLQFRLPDGSSFTNQFPADSKLEEARSYIINEIRPSFSNFSLCTTFPRRQFAEKDYSQTLRDLQLAPSAAILILPGSSQTLAISSGEGSFLGSMFWMLVSPLLAVWRVVMSLFRGGGDTSPPQEEEVQQAAADPTPEPGPSGIQDNEAAPSTSSSESSSEGSVNNQESGLRKREPKKVYKEGNVFRISNLPADDDDNNTWNGNSTQQM